MTPRNSQIGTVRECEHPRVRHEHGHHTTYKRDGCGCEACTLAYRRWRKRRGVLTSRGQRLLVDAAPTREHVEALLAGGLTVGQVQDRSGVNRSTIRTLLGVFPGRDRLVKLQRPTASRLLSVTSDRVAEQDRGRVDPTGSARRLQALVANGWTLKQISAELGRSKVEDVRSVVYAERLITVRTRREVAALYDRWWNRQPSATNIYEKRAATSARRYALRHGWVPALSWDDDTIDDPTAPPAHDLQPTREPGDRSAQRLVLVDDVELLTSAGVTREDLAARLGVQPQSLQVSLERAGRRDLWLRLSQPEAARTRSREAAA